MTGEQARDRTIDSSFLGPHEYVLESYQDGVNAGRFGSDYQKETSIVSEAKAISIHLNPEGGWAARLQRK